MASMYEMEGVGTYRANVFDNKSPVRYFYEVVHVDNTNGLRTMILKYKGYSDLDGRHPAPAMPDQ